METVTVKGKVYQIGAIYYAAGDYLELVSAGDGEFILTGPDCGSIDVATNKIRVVDQLLGTITDAPIELEDGGFYSFEYQGNTGHGRYSERDNNFYSFGAYICNATIPTDIKAVEERT